MECWSLERMKLRVRSISSEGVITPLRDRSDGLLGGVLNSGVPPGGGAASSDVLRQLALMHLHSLFRRKPAMPAVTVETFAIPICFAISYECELLLTEPGGRGTARDGVGFPKATRSHILYEKMWRDRRYSLEVGYIDGLYL
jgi:hypothetical protein